MKEGAISLDFDGPLTQRPPFQVKTLGDLVLYGSVIYDPPTGIPVVDRRVSNQHLKLPELISLIIQGQRHLVPGVVEILRELVDDQYDLFVNTGRPNGRLWEEATKGTLGYDVLPLFQGFFFTPRGVSGLLSKGAAIRELLEKGYETVMHVDDDPLTVLRLARFFPDVSFVLVEDLTTGILLSGVNLERDYPKVRRVRTLREAFSGGINR